MKKWVYAQSFIQILHYCFTKISVAVYNKVHFIIMQLCDWGLLAIMLTEIINVPITKFPLSWLQQVQK